MKNTATLLKRFAKIAAAMVGMIFIAFAANADSDKSSVPAAILEKARALTGRALTGKDIIHARLDADDVKDIAVLHAADKEKSHHLIILKGNSDGTFKKVYDKSAAGCPDCGGMKGRPAVFKLQGRTINVSEMGGSRWAWSYESYYRFNGSEFGLSRMHSQTFDSLTGDVVDRNIHLNSGLERRKIEYGRRSEYKSSRNRKYKLDAMHLVAAAAKRTIKLDGRAGEAAWARAKTVRITSGGFIYYGRSYRRGRKDLSFDIKSLHDSRYVYFFLNVTDDRRVFGRRAGVGTDHVELWLRSMTPGDDTIMMNPKFNSARTVQFGLVPVRGGNRVIVRRWFPKNRPGIGVEARYRKTRRGWSMEIRMDRALVFRGNSPAVLFTAAVSDADSSRAGKRKTLMGTSRLSRRAPGHLGVLVRDSILNQGLSR